MSAGGCRRRSRPADPRPGPSHRSRRGHPRRRAAGGTQPGGGVGPPCQAGRAGGRPARRCTPGLRGRLGGSGVRGPAAGRRSGGGAGTRASTAASRPGRRGATLPGPSGTRDVSGQGGTRRPWGIGMPPRASGPRIGLTHGMTLGRVLFAHRGRILPQHRVVPGVCVGFFIDSGLVPSPPDRRFRCGTRSTLRFPLPPSERGALIGQALLVPLRRAVDRRRRRMWHHPAMEITWFGDTCVRLKGREGVVVADAYRTVVGTHRTGHDRGHLHLQPRR